jgi:hypothetical protein
MTNSKTVYGVFAEGWDYYATPKLKKLFFHSSDAEAEAEKLRNEEYDTWALSCNSKIYCYVTVEELEIY